MMGKLTLFLLCAAEVIFVAQAMEQYSNGNNFVYVIPETLNTIERDAQSSVWKLFKQMVPRSIPIEMESFELRAETTTEAPTEEPTTTTTQGSLLGGLGGGHLVVLYEVDTATTPPPTEATTPLPTETPTEVPTEAPAVAPTEAPTLAPTEAPTVAPTVSPTEAPTTSKPVSTTPGWGWGWVWVYLGDTPAFGQTFNANDKEAGLNTPSDNHILEATKRETGAIGIGNGWNQGLRKWGRTATSAENNSGWGSSKNRRQIL